MDVYGQKQALAYEAAVKGIGAACLGSYQVGAGAAPPVERESIASALNEQDGIVSELHSALTRLTEFLHSVLEDEPSPTGQIGGGASVAAVNVVRRVRSSNRTIAEAVARVERLASRVQL